MPTRERITFANKDRVQLAAILELPDTKISYYALFSHCFTCGKDILAATRIAKNLGIPSAMWPIFGLVWPSSIVLANFMLSYDYTNKRILEIGCGIGLTSLLLNNKFADISATDIHPEAENS